MRLASQRSQGTFLLIVLVAGGAAWLVGPRTGASGDPGRIVSDSTPPSRNEPATSIRVPGTRQGLTLLQAFTGSAEPKRLRLDVVVAILPDPYDSHLDWAFDSQLEAARRAFEATGFVADRFWLPGADSVLASGGEGERKVARREVQPGVLLFRRQNDDKTVDLRLLYVVGELPTSGVQRAALRAALRERRFLLDSVTTISPHQVRIVGPTFSGSSLSLRQVLDEAPENGLMPEDTVTVVSGSASSYGNLATLSSSTGPVIRFAATVHPNESLTRALRQSVLRPLGIPDQEVALLQESSTQYGLSTVDSVDAGGFLVVPFPMSIASLRAEYLRNPAAEAAAPGTPLPIQAPRLPLNLQDARRPREDIPLTSALTPAALDLVVDEIVRTLVDHRIRAVGLLFTDVRDKLVLGKELRRRMRDVQLFTYESNMLYLRSDQNEAMRGMLVLSTYPLASATQWWSRARSPQRLSFPSDAAEGMFNATLLQIGNPGAVVDYRAPLDSTGPVRPPIWVTTVGRGGFLPLTAVVDTILSRCYLAVPPPAAPASGCTEPKPVVAQQPSELVTRPLGVLPFVTVALAVTFLLVLGGVAVTVRNPAAVAAPAAPPGDPAMVQLRRRLVVASLTIHKGLYSVLAGSALFCVFLFAVGLRLRLALAPTGRLPIWLWLAGFCAALVLWPLARAGMLAIRTLSEHRAEGWRYGFRMRWGNTRQRLLWRAEVVGRVLVVVFGIGFVGLTLGFLRSVWALGPAAGPEFQVYFHRAAQVDTLASPLLPAILAGVGYAAWSAWHLWRVVMLEQQPTFEQYCERAAIGGAAGRTLRRLGNALADVRSRLFLVVPTPGAFGLLPILGIGLIWLFGQFGVSMEAIGRPGASGARTSFDWLMQGSIGAAMFSIAWATCRFMTVWSAFDRGLEAVQAMPLGAALDRLPPGVAGLARLRLPRIGEDQFAAMLAERQQANLEGLGHDVRLSLDAETAPDRPPTVPAALAPVLRVATSTTANGLDPADQLGAIAKALRAAASLGIQPDEAGASNPVGRWLKAAEDLVALQLVVYLEWVTQQLRVLALFLLLSLVLTILLLAGYPFYPRHLVMLCFVAVLLAAVGAVLYVNIRMSRDETLSRIAKTTPGKISWNANFVGNLVTFGAVPLLTLLGSEFPQLRTALFSWAKPLLDLFGKP